MNRDTISDALDLIDTKYISETMRYSGKHDDSALERSGTMLTNNRKRTVRRIAVAAAAVCIVMAMGITAYAMNTWGIREILGNNTNYELPPSAADIIQPHSESGSSDGFTARMTETLCDANTFMTTVTVTGGDNVILAAADAGRDDHVRDLELGIDEDMTIGEYAAKTGRRICPVSASINGSDEDHGIPAYELSYARQTDNEITLLLIADKTVSFAGKELVCKVYVSDLSDPESLTVIEIPFTVTEESPRLVGEYSTRTPDACEGMILGDAVVTETALGYSLRMPVTMTDETAFYNVLLECREADFLGGLVLEDDGTWYADWLRGEGSIGDSFTIHCSNVETGETICDIEFVRK